MTTAETFALWGLIITALGVLVAIVAIVVQIVSRSRGPRFELDVAPPPLDSLSEPGIVLRLRNTGERIAYDVRLQLGEDPYNIRDLRPVRFDHIRGGEVVSIATGHLHNESRGPLGSGNRWEQLRLRSKRSRYATVSWRVLRVFRRAVKVPVPAAHFVSWQRPID